MIRQVKLKLNKSKILNSHQNYFVIADQMFDSEGHTSQQRTAPEKKLKNFF